MFGFRRSISAYDEKYLNEKKQVFEDLLNIKARLEDACVKYDSEFPFIKSSYEATKKADYVSIVQRNNQQMKIKKDYSQIIDDAIKLQSSDLKCIEERMKQRMKELFNGKNVIFNNILKVEESKYYYALALYKELNNISFIKDIGDLEKYIMAINLVYSNFLADEYTKLNQVR